MGEREDDDDEDEAAALPPVVAVVAVVVAAIICWFELPKALAVSSTIRSVVARPSLTTSGSRSTATRLAAGFDNDEVQKETKAESAVEEEEEKRSMSGGVKAVVDDDVSFAKHRFLKAA